MRALFVLTPAESKRLIGKGVANMEEVRRAKERGRIIIGHGSTNVYVAEEILGKEEVSRLFSRDAYMSGLTVRGNLCTTVGNEKGPILLINHGLVEPPPATMSEMLREFGPDSVFIKGANAVDPEGRAAAFMAHPEGGTIGWAIGIILAKGIPLVAPVGLEKLIPSVEKALPMCGQQTYDYCQGLRVGLMPLSGARVVTEITALKELCGVESTHVASGGCGGSEGSVVLVTEGATDVVEKAIELVESIKGEPPLAPRKGICATCTIASPAQPKDYKTDGFAQRCRFEKKKESDLPGYLRDR